MAITEGKQRCTDGQDNRVQDAGKQSNESNWQVAVRIGAQAARRKNPNQSQNQERKQLD